MNPETFLEWLKKENLYRKALNAKPYLKRVFHESLAVKDEQILIITDKGSKNRKIAPIIGAGYYLAAQDLNLNTQLVVQGIKTSGEPADSAVEHALTTLEKLNIVIMPVSNKLGEIEDVGKSFRKFMRKRRHRFITAPSLGAVETRKLRYIVNAIDIDYAQLHQEQMPVKNIFDQAHELHITSPAGCDFTIALNGITSISNDGMYRAPQSGGNLPTGEVYLPPAPDGVNGKIVIDLSSRNMNGTTLLKKPITMEVEKSTVVSLNGGRGAKLLEKSLSLAEERAKYPERVRKIAEFGVGFNPNAKIVGAMIVDEKVKGTAHIALGSNYWFGGDIKTIVHYDQVFNKPTVFVDGKELLLKE